MTTTRPRGNRRSIWEVEQHIAAVDQLYVLGLDRAHIIRGMREKFGPTTAEKDRKAPSVRRIDAYIATVRKRLLAQRDAEAPTRREQQRARLLRRIAKLESQGEYTATLPFEKLLAEMDGHVGSAAVAVQVNSTTNNLTVPADLAQLSDAELAARVQEMARALGELPARPSVPALAAVPAPEELEGSHISPHQEVVAIRDIEPDDAPSPLPNEHPVHKVGREPPPRHPPDLAGFVATPPHLRTM